MFMKMSDREYSKKLKSALDAFRPYAYKYSNEDIGNAIVRYEMDRGASPDQIYATAKKMMDPKCDFGINNNNRIDVTDLMMIQATENAAKAYMVYMRTKHLRKF